MQLWMPRALIAPGWPLVAVLARWSGRSIRLSVSFFPLVSFYQSPVTDRVVRVEHGFSDPNRRPSPTRCQQPNNARLRQDIRYCHVRRRHEPAKAARSGEILRSPFPTAHLFLTKSRRIRSLASPVHVAVGGGVEFFVASTFAVSSAI